MTKDADDLAGIAVDLFGRDIDIAFIEVGKLLERAEPDGHGGRPPGLEVVELAIADDLRRYDVFKRESAFFANVAERFAVESASVLAHADGAGVWMGD